MKSKERKSLQKTLAKENIELYLNLLKTRFRPNYDSLYIKQILDIAKSFNIRLEREEKLSFCKSCKIFWTVENREIRINSQTKAKEVICKNCGKVRRFRYK